jgi:hypothetical protein
MKRKNPKVLAAQRILEKDDPSQNEKLEFFILASELTEELGEYEYNKQVFSEMDAEVSKQCDEDIVNLGGTVRTYHNEIAEIARRNLK